MHGMHLLHERLVKVFMKITIKDMALESKHW